MYTTYLAGGPSCSPFAPHEALLCLQALQHLWQCCATMCHCVIRIDAYVSLDDLAATTQHDPVCRSTNESAKGMPPLETNALTHPTCGLHLCWMLQGLLKYDYSTGYVTLLATHVSKHSLIDPDTPITYANDLAIARDGTIYFTSCTGQACPQLPADFIARAPADGVTVDF